MNDTYDTEYCLDIVFRTRQMSLPSHTFFQVDRLGTVSNNYYIYFQENYLLNRESSHSSRLVP